MTAYPAFFVPSDSITKAAPANVSTIKAIDNTNHNFFIKSRPFFKLNFELFWKNALSYYFIYVLLIV